MVVEPAGLAFDTLDGEAVMAAAVRNGVAWPTVCHGLAECGVCVMSVVDGVDALSPVEPKEADMLRRVPGLRRLEAPRLACQAIVHADVVVRKRGVRAAG